MKFNEDKVPSTIDEAIEDLFQALEAADINFILEQGHAQIHFGFGMLIRNQWSIWDKETPLVQDFVKRFNLFGHGDDVYAVIIEGLWAKVRCEDVEAAINNTVQSITDHWIQSNIHPQTGERTL